MAPPRLFPYEPRLGQDQLAAAVEDTVHRGGHLVVEAGTGLGKTASVLAAAVEAATARDLRILWLTRTNSQGQQVVLEWRRIRERLQGTHHIASLQGRRSLCLLKEDDAEVAAAGPEELARMCRDRKEALTKPRGAIVPCSYYANLVRLDRFEVVAWAKEHQPTPEEILDAARIKSVCPYEVTKGLVPGALVVVAPYPYFFDAELRSSLFTWLRSPPDRFIVVVDEAHNLPDYARSLRSSELTIASVRAARHEVEQEGDADLGRGLVLSRVLIGLEAAVANIVEEHTPENDEGPVPPGEFEAELMHRLGATSNAIDAAATRMFEYGEAVREKRRNLGLVPRSHVGAVSSFLAHWAHADDEATVRLAVDGDRPRIETYCLDPAPVLEAIRDAAASIHMSGTLSPLEAYRDILGLPEDTRLLRVMSPFEAERRLDLYADDVTTQYEARNRDPTHLRRIAQHVAAVAEALPGRNVAAFFPSHAMLAEVRAMAGLAGALVEEQRMSQEDLMGLVEAMRASRGSVLLGVLGGRLAEGIDFPEGALQVAVIVGLPYPKPTFRRAALRHYLDATLDKGFEYAVELPMVQRVLQAAGRVIRAPEDRGAIVILDERAPRLAHALPRLQRSEDLVADLRRFFHAEPGARPKA